MFLWGLSHRLQNFGHFGHVEPVHEREAPPEAEAATTSNAGASTGGINKYKIGIWKRIN